MKRLIIFSLTVLSATQVIGQSVDPLTGRLQMAIDLFGLSHGGITVPVSIGHHGSSMRVREGEGSCGVGWGLNAGGAVTRIVRGLPDDVMLSGVKEGWLYNNRGYNVQSMTSLPNDYLDVTDYADEADAWNFLNTCGSKFDTEPDLFYITAPGVSAQFVLAPDGQPKLLNYQDIAITVVRPVNVITEFIVKTPAGLTYTFNVKEDVTRTAVPVINPNTGVPIPVTYQTTQFNAHVSPTTFTESWNLTTITSLSSDAVATFTYTSGADAFGAQEYWANDDLMYYLTDDRDTKLLSGVSLGGSSLGFSWNDRLISMVNLTAGNETKSYRFVYYSTYETADTNPRIQRYFLRELRPEVNCVPFPSYDFRYHSLTYNGSGVDVPISTGEDQDLWGYYAAPAVSSPATAYHFNSASDAARLLFSNPGGQGASVATVDRNWQNFGDTGGMFGALTEISTPGGGVTKVSYEPNSYYDPIANEAVLGAGIRVSNIFTYAGEQAYGRTITDQPKSHAIETSYGYVQQGSSVTSGKLTYPPEYVFTNGTLFIATKDHMGDPSEVLYSRTEERILGKGKTVYEFNLPGVYPALSEGDWDATRTYIARNSGISVGYLKNGSYTYPYPPHTNYNFERGSLAAVKVYAEGGTTPIRSRTMTYSRNPSTPEIIYGIRHERTGNIFHFGKYKVLTGIASVVTQEVVQTASEVTPTALQTTTTNYTYGGTPVLLQEVTTSLPDGSQSRRKIKYARDYAITSPSGDAATAIKYFNDNGRKSQVIESINYLTPSGGPEYVTSAGVTLFKSFSGYTRPHQAYSFPATTGFTESTVTGSPQQFSFDTDYILAGTTESYTVAGQPLDQTDNKKNRISFHYATNLPVGPIASFANTKSSQSVYEGFEANTGRGLTIGGGTPTYPSGWTGNKSLQLTTALALSNTSVEKNGNNSYRVSCWVTAAQASTVTFQARNGGTLVSGSPVALSYNPSPLNQWIYLEGTMNVTNANSTFTIEVVSNATVTIDDILAMPSNASATFSTYSPLNGVTSMTDDRGHSVKQTYDAIGRKVNTLDRKRSLVARNEYQSAKSPGAALVAGIDVNVTQFQTGVQATFTSIDNCLAGLSYSWVLYPGAQQVWTSSSFNHTFTQPGSYELSLTITNQYGSATHTKSICVELHPSTVPTLVVANVSGLPDPLLVKECLNTNNKTFTVTNPPTCSETGYPTNYMWERYESSTGFWRSLYDIQPIGDFDGPQIEFFVYGGDQIRCRMMIECGANSIPQCPGSTQASREVSASFTFVPEPNGCQ